jgi:hypothetical protein
MMEPGSAHSTDEQEPALSGPDQTPPPYEWSSFARRKGPFKRAQRPALIVDEEDHIAGGDMVRDVVGEGQAVDPAVGKAKERPVAEDDPRERRRQRPLETCAGAPGSADGA